jgi:hypothetical protein
MNQHNSSASAFGGSLFLAALLGFVTVLTAGAADKTADAAEAATPAPVSTSTAKS